VTFEPSVACAQHPASGLDAAIIGGSFMHPIAESLINAACLRRLNLYFYLEAARFAGPKVQVQKRPLEPQDIAPVLDAKLVIFEENEAVIGRTRHLKLFHPLVTAR
jgi:hypothetical protein